MKQSEIDQNAFRPLTPEVRAELDAIYRQKLEVAQGFAPVEPTGTVYYVSSIHGSDDFDGTSPDRPLKTPGACTPKLQKGDTILFECGSIFRRSVNDAFITDLKNGVTLATYGIGPKPIFYGSIKVPAEDWVRVGNSNVYCFDGKALDLNIYGDVGSIIFDEGKIWGVKTLMTFKDPKTKKIPANETLALRGVYNGLETVDIPSYPFTCGADLRGDLSFYHDYSEKRVYLCCEGGNPAERFSSVELTLSRFPFYMENHAANITFLNLDFRNFGTHVIRPMNCKNITVKNCEFRFVGGVIMPQYGEWRNYYTRLGNAVENWGSCNGLTVENCYFDQLYDTVVTTQSNSAVASKKVICKNNVAERFWWGVELWTAGNVEFSGVDVSGNYFKQMGEGFTTQRPDKIDPDTDCSVNAFVLLSNGPYEMKRSFSVTDNIVDGSTGKMLFCSWPKTNETDDGVRFDRNTYVAPAGGDFARLFARLDKNGGVTCPYTAEGIAQAQKSGIEEDGVFYFTE